MIRRSVMVVLLAGLMAPAGSAMAQLARPRAPAPDAPKLLVAPLQREAQDSALSLLVADGMRERLRANHLDKFNALSRQNMNENLTQSGFPIDVPLESRVVRDLVRFLNARYVIEGTMQRKPGDSIQIIARLSEGSGANPQTATRSWTLPASQVRSSTGAELVNRLVEGYRSFEDVAQCRRALEQNNPAVAMREAQEALRDYPNSAAAYQCIASVQEAQNAPPDTVLATLRRAYDADTLNVITMRRLASRYQTANDTANLVNMLRRILNVDFRDNDLRINTARLLVTLERLPDAVEVIEQGLAQNPASAELLSVKMIALGALRRWDSAAAVGELIKSIDTARVDSAFVVRITNYYRQVPDTTKWLEWARVGAMKFPAMADLWYTVSSISLVRGDSNAAKEAAENLLRALPQDPAALTDPAQRGLYARGNYVLAMLSNARGQADTALAYADRAVTADSTIKPQVAFVPLIVGARLRGDSTQLERAVELLQRSMDWGANNPRVVGPAGFQLAVGQVQLGVQVDRIADGQRNCDASRRLQQLMTDAETNLGASMRAGGASAQQRQIANQLLSETIPGYKQRAEQLIRNNCRG